MSMYWPPEMGDIHRGASRLIWAGGQPTDLQKLWSAAPIDIANHEHPGVDGALPREVMIVQAEHDLTWHLSTMFMPDGSPAANPAAGFLANYRELVERCGTKATWGALAASITVIDALGLTLQGEAQIAVGAIGVERGSVVPVAVAFTITDGELALVSS